MSLMSSILFFHIINYFCISYNFNISSKRLRVSCLQTLFLLCITHLKNAKHILYTERDGQSEGKVRLMARLSAIAVCFLQQHNSLLFKIIFVHLKLNNFHRKPFNFSFINSVWAGKNIKQKIFPWELQGDTENIQAWLEQSAKMVWSPGLWKHSVLGSTYAITNSISEGSALNSVRAICIFNPFLFLKLDSVKMKHTSGFL